MLALIITIYMRFMLHCTLLCGNCGACQLIGVVALDGKNYFENILWQELSHEVKAGVIRYLPVSITADRSDQGVFRQTPACNDPIHEYTNFACRRLLDHSHMHVRCRHSYLRANPQPLHETARGVRLDSIAVFFVCRMVSLLRMHQPLSA
ncbi:MAG: hypothetical protein V4805_12895 [Pseudomonadota bacterium]